MVEPFLLQDSGPGGAKSGQPTCLGLDTAPARADRE